MTTSFSHMFPTLYTPATTAPDKLLRIMHGGNEFVRRLVVCTEDSVAEADLPLALANIAAVLKQYKTGQCDVYVRARNATILKALLDVRHINKVAGFVVPKANPKTFPGFADQVASHLAGFRLMPIMESCFLPDPLFRRDLRQMFDSDSYKPQIECLRIGANDIMGYQGIRRDQYEFTIYDTVVRGIIDSIINEFRGLSGFQVTAPVFEGYSPRQDDLFRREVRQNMLNGLFGQTVIHPRHLPLLFDLYKVLETDFQSARAIVQSDAAVAGLGGRMDERATHLVWAQRVVERASLFGTTL